MRKLLSRTKIGLGFAALFLFVSFAPLALAAAPWAWYTSLSAWGYTPWEEWKEDWAIYSKESFQGLWKELGRLPWVIPN